MKERTLLCGGQIPSAAQDRFFGFGPEALTLALMAATQAVLMSVYQTLKLRGLNPLNTIVSVLRTCTETGRLPPLPGGNTVRG